MDAGAIIQSVVIRIPVQWNILNIRMSRATGETGDLLPEDSGKILEEGKITEKERLLWEYVLSAYGAEEFTTKQLEKDFRNAAYATIRTFVMKFHEMGLLTARKAGNRVFYRVGGASDVLSL